MKNYAYGDSVWDKNKVQVEKKKLVEWFKGRVKREVLLNMVPLPL